MGKKTAPGPPKKIIPEWGKMCILRVFFPKFHRFLPKIPDFFPFQAILQLLGSKNPKSSALRANFGHNHSTFVPAHAKNWGRKQVSWTVGVGKKQLLWPEYLRVKLA